MVNIDSEARLRLEGISKAYPGVQALDEVSFAVERGSIHGLAGQNGAGKSTLVKILSGAEFPDKGVIYVDGERAKFRQPMDARKAGISTIYQELSLVPSLSVAENIFLDSPPLRRKTIVNWPEMKARARDALAAIGFDLNVTRLVSSFSIAEQQVVELAKALHHEARILLLDEPTSALPPPDVARLFAVLRSLAERGISLLYISHRIDEIYSLCDCVTVLRDGKKVAEINTASTKPSDVVTAMVGRGLEKSLEGEALAGEHVPRLGPGPRNRVLMKVEGLSDGTMVSNVTFDLYEGEVLGVTGLIGSGQSELAALLAGARRKSTGAIQFNGRYVDYKSPQEAIRDGIGLLPQDRKARGFIPGMGVAENITLASLPMFSRLGVIQHDKERKAANALAERLAMRISSIEQPMKTLSGGTQQKGILARWLVRSSKLLICDEPTRGVDVGAKEDIYELLRDFVARGGTVIIAASELPEALMCDRVLVMARGQVVAELQHDEFGPGGRALLEHLR
jgi:ribose transport system ATP-binding protein